MVINIRKIQDYKLNNNTVLVRADFNIALDVNNKPIDHSRIDNLLPTIEFLKNNNAKVIIISHFGRPKLHVDGFAVDILKKHSCLDQKILYELKDKLDCKFSLEPIAFALSNFLKNDTFFIPNIFGYDLIDTIKNLDNKKIIILENLRFFQHEESNDLFFAKYLSSLGDFYVNDAFSCSHRAHSSTCGITKFLNSAAGFSLQKELLGLDKAMNNPKKPIAAIVGGAKISSKISVLKNLATKFNYLLIGGAMAHTFLLAKGYKVGKSLVENDQVNTAHEISNIALKYNCKIILPSDFLVKMPDGKMIHNVDINKIIDEGCIVDMGDASLENFYQVIKNCNTILWNGPVGAFEHFPDANKSILLAQKIGQIFQASQKNNNPIVTIAGGGETLAAVKMAGLKEGDGFTILSTAGGAFLEFLEGKNLPAIKALEN